MNIKLLISRPLSRQVATGTVLLLTVCCSIAHAQAIYRIVDSNGKVTFSDKPPASTAKTNAVGAASNASDNNSSGSTTNLPVTLRKVASQFPVTLYTGKDCVPCSSGRSLLINRGIPFSEKTVDNNESADALKQLSGQTSIPMLSIGSQQLPGFSDASWTQYLNAAGYPEKSLLPSNYKRPNPTPLAEAKAASVAPTQTQKVITPAETTRKIPVVPPAQSIRF